ncbi:hypothetical protein FO675_07160 [Riemerella anatipestifer]|uniref:phosphoadenosine phosphosulfate reductase family protein n=1 Tax=Riemerella anatipestifer TaxID=34085 RepID=UPI001AD79890|nr:phosphoadenosine phosphosulfate reductase family protein [Riemerella anatipestifer]MBO4234080.1 hypothetical protein [Riemerella anatipestifer]
MAKLVLGKKQNSKNEDFVKVWNNIEDYVSKAEITALIDETVLDIQNKTKGKKTAYSWSGGKDSIALQIVCELAGIENCILAVSSPIEYPAFTGWVSKNKPKGLTVFDANIGLNYVAENPEMLFPNSTNAAKWFRKIQHRGQKQYFKENDLDIIILGRRLQDGNYVGRGTNIYTNQEGITRFSPLYQWKHEHILAAIHYFKNRNIPPIYDTPNGWVVGTGVWPARQFAKDEATAWQELYLIDRNIVLEGTKYFKGAKDCINRNEQTAR